MEMEFDPYEGMLVERGLSRASASRLALYVAMTLWGALSIVIWIGWPSFVTAAMWLSAPIFIWAPLGMVHKAAPDIIWFAIPISVILYLIWVGVLLGMLWRGV